MFSDVLRSLRTQYGLSQEELGKKVGLAKSTISMYENGTREPNLETLEAIADIFNVDMNTLTDSKTKDTQKLELSKHEEVVVTAYRNKPEMQPAVDRLLGIEDDELIAVPVAARSENNKPVGFAYISKEKLEQLNNAKCVADEVDL